MHIERTKQFTAGICDEQSIDAVAFHHFHRLDCEFFGADGMGGAVHQVGNADLPQVDLLAEGAAQVAVGENALHDSRIVNDGGDAEPAARHGQHSLGHAGLRRDDGKFFCMHHIAHMCQQAAAEHSAGVRTGEILGAEAVCIEQRDGQGVAQRQRGGRAGRRGEVERAGFFGDTSVEVGIGLTCQGRVRIAGDGDEAGPLALDERDDEEQLLRLAGIGQRQQQIVAGDHAQVAVAGLGRMHEVGRRAGARHGGGDLAGDMAGFADAADDQAAAAIKDERDGGREVGVETVDQAEQGLGFDFEGLAGEIEGAFRVGRKGSAWVHGAATFMMREV